MNRHNKVLLSLATTLVVTTATVTAEDVLITSLGTDGVLAWTNSYTTGCATVEIATSLVVNAWLPHCNIFTSNSYSIAQIETIAPATYVRVVCADRSTLETGLCLVPAGTFLMGNSYTTESNETWYLSETPVHLAHISSYSIEKYEVTKSLWNNVYGWAIANGYGFRYSGSGAGNNFPVHTINWYDCIKWCNARSERAGLQPVYYTDSHMTNVYRSGETDIGNESVDWVANGYRLPTEAEWEKAARGGLTGHHYPWSSYGLAYTNYIDGTKCNYGASGDAYEMAGTSPVGYYDGHQVVGGLTNGSDMANGYGAYDFAGNIGEWCWDRYGQYGAEMAADPRGSTNGTERVVRGGTAHLSWNSPWLRCAGRNHNGPVGMSTGIGLRCARHSN